MQAKDIPEKPILEFLAKLNGKWAFLLNIDHEQSLFRVMPNNTPCKVALAKMRSLYRRKLVEGCPCGCRGDFEITGKGQDELARYGPQ